MAPEGCIKLNRGRLISSAMILAAGLLGYPRVAAAYIGPGMAAGAVASILGILAGIGMVLVGIVWYPIKALLRKLRKRKE
jgi:hypothetical protein